MAVTESDYTDDLARRLIELEAKFAMLQALVIDDFADIKRQLRDLSAATVPGDA